jgi:uncharacterized membrane protein
VTADTMTVTWEKNARNVTETVDKTLRLSGAPEITANGRQVRPAAIIFEFRRLNGGPWRSKVTIYADQPYSDIRAFFSPDEVYRAPQWLTDLIDDATPKEEK